jgi:uncharacterized protein
MMPSNFSYPGVFITEFASSVARRIPNVATSTTAFVGRIPRGPLDSDATSPVRVTSYAEYERHFGGLANDSPLSFAVQHYFANGGGVALIVRVVNGAATAQTPAAPHDALFSAANPGAWGNALRLRVEHDVDAEETSAEAADTLFNLAVKDLSTGVVESFRNLSITAGHPREASRVLAEQSQLLRGAAVFNARPDANTAPSEAMPDPFGDSNATALSGGTDGEAVSATHITSGEGLRANRQGLYALQRVDLFNLLVIPPLSASTDVDPEIWSHALEFCVERRAMLLVDPPFHAGGWHQAGDLTDAAITAVVARSANAALFFPRLRATNPLREGQAEDFAPCGAVAGLIALTDAQRGVWKSPAGTHASLKGVLGPSVALADQGLAAINSVGVNGIRHLPARGTFVWGARTTLGSHEWSSDWKYLSVRRFALHIEESLYRGTQWALFEPNGEALWAQIRLTVGRFLLDLFHQGAFQGATPKDAFFLHCGARTTTQSDIDRGVVNIVVGFAALKPAEFIVIRLQQPAGRVPD